MPRDLPLGNGGFLVNFDQNYTLRDIYFPHVGQENQTEGDPNRFGVWVDGQFSWPESDRWRRELRYEDETLVTTVTCKNDDLGLELLCADCVDFHRNLYVKRIEVRDQTGRERRVRLFQHLDLHLGGNAIGDTVLYEPDHRSLVAYKACRYLWLGGRAGDADGLTRWATGTKEVGGREGTWRDAEDGELGGNPIAQGSVDCVGGVDLVVPAGGSAVAYFWIGAGTCFDEVRVQHESVVRHGPQSFIDRTRAYWHLWVNKESPTFGDLPPEVAQLYKHSLLILRTQIDDGGAIVAANDADILRFGRDTYSYTWPRDGALVAHALVLAGYGQVTRKFFDFCAAALRPEGYLLHKYNPDGSPGSSWHPWLAPDGTKQLPIQEDETALVLWALWAHFQRFRDVEFIKPLYRKLVIRAADFLCRFREPHTGLPAPSYDLWEERHGIMAYTTAAVVAGIGAAANFSDAFGETTVAAAYRKEADAMSAAARRYLYDSERGCFSRMIQVRADGSIVRDKTLDASIAGIFEFGLLPPDDPLIQSTMEAIERRLWCKTTVGGIARYEDDYYHQVSRDVERVPGNPWFICTLWLANWHIAKARMIADLGRARELLGWVVAHARQSGVLAEQIHPYSGEPLSVSPLTWSHAAFVELVNLYVARRKTILR
ncbi:MAG: glycoside hydrolase family 15 protein [Chloroflexi bacterium]|nr:glycoside hydrolase family 15 protein [Chloroflexota bacterium]